jgi:hypothetical protein
VPGIKQEKGGKDVKTITRIFRNTGLFCFCFSGIFEYSSQRSRYTSPDKVICSGDEFLVLGGLWPDGIDLFEKSHKTM